MSWIILFLSRKALLWIHPVLPLQRISELSPPSYILYTLIYSMVMVIIFLPYLADVINFSQIFLNKFPSLWDEDIIAGASRLLLLSKTPTPMSTNLRIFSRACRSFNSLFLYKSEWRHCCLVRWAENLLWRHDRVSSGNWFPMILFFWCIDGQKSIMFFAYSLHQPQELGHVCFITL